jgi:signal transduction histidine kinase
VSPGSTLRRRLLLAGLAGIALVTVLAAWLLGEVFRHTAQRGFERILQQELAGVVGRLQAQSDGSVGMRDRPGDPDYERVFSGRYWQAGIGEGAILSRSLWDFEPKLPPPPADGSAETLHADGPAGQRLLLVRQRVTLPRASAPLLVWVGADESPLLADVRSFRWQVAASTGLLASLFAGVLFVQVRVGLRPLADLAAGLRRLRSGEQARLGTAHLPAEVQPLASHLNDLLEHHERNTERARNATGDLAHALKTPLAALDAAAQRPGPELAQRVREQVARMQAVVQRQLSPGLSVDFNARTPIAPVANELARLMGSAHRRAELKIEVDIDPALVFPAGVEDLQELLGNLLDNACKWAATQVRVSASQSADGVSISVEDDGPGMSTEAARAARLRGVRLDQQVPGTGLGLAIVEDILEAVGGQLHLQRSALGGLQARIEVVRRP